MSEQLSNVQAPEGAVTEATEALRELDARKFDGIEVRLLWDADLDQTSVSVNDARTGEEFQFPVPGEDAMEAFHHPYSYAAHLGEMAVNA